MAVTLTLEQLADHLRMDRAAVGSGDPRRTILVELQQVATKRVEGYAPNADSDTQNLAVAQMAGYIYDAPPVGRSFTTLNAFQHSGAQALLAPYRVPSFATVGAGSTATTAMAPTTIPETPVGPSMPVPPPAAAATRYFAVKATDDFMEADFLGGVEFDENGDIVVPAFPMGVTQAYFGVAVEHGKTVTQYLFSPDQFAQVTTANWDPNNPVDVIIVGEPYSAWSSGRYTSFTVGHVLRITVEDV